MLWFWVKENVHKLADSVLAENYQYLFCFFFANMVHKYTNIIYYNLHLYFMYVVKMQGSCERLILLIVSDKQLVFFQYLAQNACQLCLV